MDNKKRIIKKLRNGITVLIIPSNTILTNVSVSILLGENHEKPDEIELTHYMEHLMGRFTSKKHNDVKKINSELNKRGATTNASVDKYETNFYIRGYYKDIEYYIDLLSNTIKNFKLEKSLIKQEKNAVIQELNNNMSDHEYIFDMKIWRYMYGKYAYQYNYKSHIQYIKKYNTNRIYDFIKNHVLLENIIVSVSCPSDKLNETMAVIRKYFNFKKTGCVKKKIMFPIYHYDNNKMKVIYIKNKYNTNSILRVIVDDSIKYYSKEHFSLLYLKDILFNFETGIFYKMLRDKLGLIYNISLELMIDINNPLSSSYSINTNVNYKNIPKLIKWIIYIIENLSLSDDEISNGKKKVLINYELEKYNDLTSYNTYYGDFLLHKLPIIEKSEVKKRMISVTNSDIRATLNKFKNDILKKGLFFYYAKKNINANISKVVKRKEIKYISLY